MWITLKVGPAAERILDAILFSVKSFLHIILVTISLCCQSDSSRSTISESTQPDVLVTADWLRQEMAIDSSLIIAKVGYGPAAGEYIPGSIHINTDEIEYDEFKARSSNHPISRTTSPDQDWAKGLTIHDTLPRNYWNLYADEYLLKALAYAGITATSKIVVYGETPEAAARLAWCLVYSGVEQVHFLNGGLNAWTDADFEISTKAGERTPVENFGKGHTLNTQYAIATDAVRSVVSEQDTSVVLLDVRSYSEYKGDTSIYDYISVGRIDGAVFGGTSSGKQSMSDYCDSSGRLRSLSILETMWLQSGITSEKDIIFYCGTGWRSSLAWLAAYSMGWKQIKNYDGSWYEWSEHYEN